MWLGLPSKDFFALQEKNEKPTFCRGPGSHSSLQGGASHGGRKPKPWMSSWSSHVDSVPLLQVGKQTGLGNDDSGTT